MVGYNHYETEGKPLKLWDTSEPFEEEAMQQLRNVAKLPFIFRHFFNVLPDAGKNNQIGKSREFCIYSKSVN